MPKLGKAAAGRTPAPAPAPAPATPPRDASGSPAVTHVSGPDDDDADPPGLGAPKEGGSESVARRLRLHEQKETTRQLAEPTRLAVKKREAVREAERIARREGFVLQIQRQGEPVPHRALHNFDPKSVRTEHAEDDLLSFEAGALIEVTWKDYGNWWYGFTRGSKDTRGFFPAVCVDLHSDANRQRSSRSTVAPPALPALPTDLPAMEAVPPAPDGPPEGVPLAGVAEGVPLAKRSLPSGGGAPAPKGTRRLEKLTRLALEKRKADRERFLSDIQSQPGAPLLHRAVHSFNPKQTDLGGTENTEDDLLLFEVGALIEVTWTKDGNWWYGFIKGRKYTQGFFPAVFVELFDAADRSSGREGTPRGRTPSGQLTNLRSVVDLPSLPALPVDLFSGGWWTQKEDWELRDDEIGELDEYSTGGSSDDDDVGGGSVSPTSPEPAPGSGETAADLIERELNLSGALDQAERRHRPRTKPPAKKLEDKHTTAPVPAQDPSAAKVAGQQQLPVANQQGYFGQAFQMTTQQSEHRAARLQGQKTDSNKTLLYHQTGAPSTKAIIESGRMKVGTHGTAGGGIYFACTEQETRKALTRGFVFMCLVKLGETLDIGRKRTSADFRKGFGKLDYKTLQMRDPPVDSVSLQTGSGPECVVYHSDQVELVMVRACDGANSLNYTSEWHDVKELQNDPAKLDLFLQGKLAAGGSQQVKALEAKIRELEAQQHNAAATEAAKKLRQTTSATAPATRANPSDSKKSNKKSNKEKNKSRRCSFCCSSPGDVDN